MINKIFWLVVIASTLVVSVIFIALAFQRHDDDDVFIKIAIWYSWPYGDAPRVAFFVINNDRTFTSYYGISRNHGDITRRNFIRTVHEKEEIILDEQAFQNITELVSTVSTTENDFELWSGMVISHIVSGTLYYNGNIYGGSNMRSRCLHELIDKVVRLSPLSVRW